MCDNASLNKEDDVTDYEALKQAGHSPLRAAQIVLDAKRGDKYAIRWIEAIRECVT